jgi:hypothetical protein
MAGGEAGYLDVQDKKIWEIMSIMSKNSAAGS